MDRQAFEAYITETYGVAADHPWMRYPSFSVFRHGENQKWFAVVMTIPKAKLEDNTDGTIDVINLKCAPEILYTFLQEPGIYPAYHMNRSHWVTVALDGRVNTDTLAFLLGVSFDLTRAKKHTQALPKDRKSR